MLRIPIVIAVIKASTYVANMFSNHDFKLKSPIIKSLEVLAIKGPLKFPLSESKASIIRISIRKLSKVTIKIERTIPAKISPTIETISDGKVSLTILPFVSRASIYHHRRQMNLKTNFRSYS
ncbi:hypothetical protein ES705_23852 [subsurface metagenome]